MDIYSMNSMLEEISAIEESNKELLAQVERQLRKDCKAACDAVDDADRRLSFMMKIMGLKDSGGRKDLRLCFGDTSKNDWRISFFFEVNVRAQSISELATSIGVEPDDLLYAVNFGRPKTEKTQSSDAVLDQEFVEKILAGRFNRGNLDICSEDWVAKEKYRVVRISDARGVKHFNYRLKLGRIENLDDARNEKKKIETMLKFVEEVDEICSSYIKLKKDAADKDAQFIRSVTKIDKYGLGRKEETSED